MWPFSSRREKSTDLSRLGVWGETQARKFLRKAGMKILAENYRCPAGEIDLIALDRDRARTAGEDTLVFVEVKTRSDDTHVEPQSAVNADKQRRIRRVANYFIQTHSEARAMPLRFDVVAIVAPAEQEHRLTHFPGAF